jgi:cytochrome c oxidase accessory protein FixG
MDTPQQSTSAKIIEIVPQASPAGADEPLFEVRKKIYPRAVSGWFARWRWGMVIATQLLFYGLCWLPWNERQAVLFNIVERKFYIFGIVFWPQDVFFLAILLIISAFGLFLFTAVAGRLWCGYACPQTVYTEIFLWIERVFEGDRVVRMRLDNAPLSTEKVARKGVKVLTWALLSAWTGFTFVGYFTPIHDLWAEVWRFSLGPWESFWLIFYSGFTYMNAGHMREQVCKYMCPYARFQGVMFDPDTLTITYDEARGEARGARKKGLDPQSIGKGDCVDCHICVQVCPTGIDIRDGLQYECIGCAACIDACDQVMDKMNYPRGLIRYSTENALSQRWGWDEILRHVARPRVLIYTAILTAVVSAFMFGLLTKSDLKVNVMRDRGVAGREVDGGLVENVYRLQVMNVGEHYQFYSIKVNGLRGIELASDNVIELPSESSHIFTVRVRVPPESGKPGANPIRFEIESLLGDAQTSEKATFLIPR